MSSKINPLETAFKLGKAYRNHDKVAIKYYKSSLSLNDIKQIWQTVTLKRSLYENLRGYSLPIQALIAEILEDTFYLDAISDSDLIKLSADPKWSVRVLNAVILKHGSEEFPTRTVMTLGEANMSTLNELMKILRDYPKYFEITAYWATQHPEIAAKVAKEWQKYFNLYPLKNSEEERTMLIAFEKLKKKYACFRNLRIGSRLSRDGGPVKGVQTPESDYFATFCVGAAIIGLGGAAYLFMPVTAIVTGFINFSAPAAVPVAATVAERLMRRSLI